ncbi:hypothetical protein [Kitasatospora azatica]|uniref:hypothetical protein n=1 Tax=Kitasatospora azatica TaxID=58347 RepID=UPI00055CE5CE|nr:hypothetical protein [Kitasatospora azatica]
MTQPSTARRTAAIPGQRATTEAAAVDTAATGQLGPLDSYEPLEPQPRGWAAVRRGLAIVRGLRTLGSVPARPQAGYGEVDGQ